MTMGKMISILLCIVMFFGSIPVFAAEAPAILVDIGFNSMPTNAEPTGVTIHNGTVLVAQPDNTVRNKVMSIKKPSGDATVDVTVNSSANNIVYQFDFMLPDNQCNKKILLKDSAGKFSTALTINQSGQIVLPDNRQPLTLEAERWYRFALVYQYGLGRYALFADGRCIADRIAVQNAAQFTKGLILRFQSTAGEPGGMFYIDNIRCYEGTELLDDSVFEKESFNESVLTPPEEEEIAADDDTVYFNFDFNGFEIGGTPSGWTILNKEDANVFQVEDFPDEENRSFYLAKQGGQDPLAETYISEFASSSAVLQFSFYSIDDSSDKQILMKDSNGQFNELFKILSGGTLTASRQEIGTYKKKTWHQLTAVMNIGARTMDVYLDGEQVKENLAFVNDQFGNPSVFRLQYPSNTGSGELYVDDVRFYAGDRIKDPSELEVTEATEGVKLITPQAEVEKTLEGLVAMTVNTASGFAEGEKQALQTCPAAVDGVMYVPARFVIEGLGGQIDWNDAEQRMDISLPGKEIQCRIGSREVVINGESIRMKKTPITLEGSSMLPLEEFAGKVLEIEQNSGSRYGLVVLGSGAESLSEKKIKDIYDLLTYTRPTKEQILKDFEPMNGVHPRIMATADDFERIRQLSKTDPNMQDWTAQLIEDSELILQQAHSTYVKPDGLRLLDTSRQVLNRTLRLGLAYQITGEEKYADYLWGEYAAVCTEFPDWNASEHFLDTAEMTNAVAIGYDWLYEYWTAEQRGIIEAALLEKGLQQGEKCYLGQSGVNGDWVTWNWNWNQVCNGGLSVGALALLDKEPEFCSWMLETAFLSMENMLGEFAPDGAWKEGPSYWSYVVSYLVYHMAALDTALGTDYGYFASNNIGQTVYSVTYNQSAQGSFNFHDAGSGIVSAAQTNYFAKKLPDPNLARVRLDEMESYHLSYSPLDLLWYDPDNVSDSVDLWPDRKFGYTETATFRSAFNDSNALFAGLHGGDNAVAHGNLDSGTFVLDALGERWASELGSDDYNLSGYFGSDQRWQYYRCNAQGQNVIALNPVSETGQSTTAFTTITEFETKEKGGFAIIDMASAYEGKVESAYRGMKMDTDRTQVVLQDEMTLLAPADLWWFMHTKAQIDISDDGKSAMLTQNGKQMYVVLDCNVKTAKFQDIAAEPLPGSVLPTQQASNLSYRKLAINIPKANNDIMISVRFIPVYGDAMLSELLENGVAETVPLSDWEIADGSIVNAEISDISIDGETVEGFAVNKYMYNVKLPFGTEEVPDVTVDVGAEFEAEVVQAEDKNGTAMIEVASKEDPAVKNYYTVKFNVMPLMGLPEGYTQYQAVKVSASAEPQPENPKENAIDGDINTRWSADGAQWLQIDLGEVKPVSVVTMAFYSGIGRVSYFDIMVSQDGQNWETVYSGESSGVTDDYESYFIGEQQARYIRVSGTGNSSNTWNSYSELQAFGHEA